MPLYRLYFHDKAGHFARGEDLEAENDRQALKCAEDFDNAFGIEVWQQSRKIGVIEPELTETR